MPTPARLSAGPPAGHAPVFTDVSGRRRKRMRRLGLGVCAGLSACLAVMAVGLLGGPRASFIPWPGLDAGASGAPQVKPSGEAGAGASQPVPNPVIMPAPGTSVSPAASSSAPRSSPRSSSPAVSTSPTPVTNRGSKTPPGRNRSPTPKPTR
jgi:hypothetical protein